MSFDEEHLDDHHECRGAYEMEKRAKDGAYAERNKLVCLLSKIFPSSIEDHVMLEGQEWDDDWRKVIFIELPTGQCTWHIHKSEEPMFSHLYSRGAKWDGHSTEEKYQRIERIDKIDIDTSHFRLDPLLAKAIEDRGFVSFVNRNRIIYATTNQKRKPVGLRQDGVRFEPQLQGQGNTAFEALNDAIKGGQSG